MSQRGLDVRRRLYETSIQLMAERGYEGATLREVAQREGVSAGLLYRYFPSKRSVLMQLYDELSAEFVARAAAMPRGRWGARFVFALKTSLAVLSPHRAVLSALVSVLVVDTDGGLFAPATGFSRLRVQGVFIEAVRGAVDCPRPRLVEPLGRMLYVAQLAVILWWLLDRTAGQRATHGSVALLDRMLRRLAPALRLRPIGNALLAADALLCDGLLS